MKKIFSLTGLVILVFLMVSMANGCFSMFMSPPSSESTPGPSATAEIKLTVVEQKAFELVNDYRIAKGLLPLQLDDRIIRAARKHSENMGQGVVAFGHNGFRHRIAAIGIKGAAAENVAYNYGYSDPAQIAVDGWIKSPGHEKNMSGDYNLTGMGIVKNANGKYYFTQIFLKN